MLSMDEVIFKEFRRQSEQIEQLNLENEQLRKMLQIRQDLKDYKWYAFGIILITCSFITF